MVEYCQPYSRALQHCMDDITHTMIFTDVIWKLLAKNIITLEEFERLPKLGNRDAVTYVVIKVIHSTNAVYMKFLEVLTEMEEPQYAELKNVIIGEYERIKSEPEIVQVAETDTTSPSPSHSSSVSTCTTELESTIPTVNSENDPDFLRSLVMSLGSKISQKTTVGKTFTEFLIYLCDFFLKAINNESVQLVDSSEAHKQYIISELEGSNMILSKIKDNFDSTCTDRHDQEQKNDFLRYVLLPILLTTANKIADIIRNVSQAHAFWKRWSSNSMSALFSLYDGISRVANGIKDIDCKSFPELIDNIDQLRACLYNVDNRLFNTQLALCIVLGTGAAICVILGAALMPTPAAPASVPLLITGGVLAWQTTVQAGFTAYTSKAVTEVVDQPAASVRGYLKDQK